MIVGLYFLMPLIGIFSHPRLRSLDENEPATWAKLVHVWLGRFLLIFGILNGVLGLKMASNSGFSWEGQYVTYILFAGIIGMAYGSALFVWVIECRRENRENGIERRGTELRDLEGR